MSLARAVLRPLVMRSIFDSSDFSTVTEIGFEPAPTRGRPRLRFARSGRLLASGVGGPILSYEPCLQGRGPAILQA